MSLNTPPAAETDQNQGENAARGRSPRVMAALAGALGWLFVAWAVDAFAIEAGGGRGPYAEIWISLSLIAAGAYWLSSRGYSKSGVALYGLLSGLVYVSRVMSALSRTLSDLGLLAWLLGAIVLAGLAYLAAHWQSAIVACLAWQNEQRRRAAGIESADSAALESSAEGQPRLGIIHLFGWMTMTAVWLGCLISDASNSSTGGGVYLWPGYAVGGGAALLGLAVFVTRRRRGMTFPIQPGEFLWVTIGFSSAVWLVTIVASELQYIFGDSARVWTLLQSGSNAEQMIGALALVAAMRCFPTARWRFFFGILIVGRVAVQVFGVTDPRTDSMLALPMFALFTLLSGIQLLGCLFLDRRHGIALTWSHWAGVLVWIAWSPSLWWVFLPLGLWLLFSKRFPTMTSQPRIAPEG